MTASSTVRTSPGDKMPNQKNGLTVEIPIGEQTEDSMSPSGRRSSRSKRSCNPHAREWPPVTATVAPQIKRPRNSTALPAMPTATFKPAPMTAPVKKEIKPQKEVKEPAKPSFVTPSRPIFATTKTVPVVKSEENVSDSKPVHHHVVKYIFNECKESDFTPKELAENGSKFIRTLKLKELETALLLLSRQGLLSRKLKCEKGERCTYIYTPRDLAQLPAFDRNLIRNGYGIAI